MKKKSLKIDLQNESDIADIPSIKQLEDWVLKSLLSDYQNLEQTIRVVNEAESQLLNNAYRGKDKPTNVLSFPSEDSEYLDYDHLGDLVICAPVVVAEAAQQNKDLMSHWAHMVVHGMLHLQGYDHITGSEAEQMETLEIEILASLGHTNPYSLV